MFLGKQWHLRCENCYHPELLQISVLFGFSFCLFWISGFFFGLLFGQIFTTWQQNINRYMGCGSVDGPQNAKRRSLPSKGVFISVPWTCPMAAVNWPLEIMMMMMPLQHFLIKIYRKTWWMFFGLVKVYMFVVPCKCTSSTKWPFLSNKWLFLIGQLQWLAQVVRLACSFTLYNPSFRVHGWGWRRN